MVQTILNNTLLKTYTSVVSHTELFTSEVEGAVGRLIRFVSPDLLSLNPEKLCVTRRDSFINLLIKSVMIFWVSFLRI